MTTRKSWAYLGLIALLSVGGAAQAQIDYDGTQDIRLSYAGIAYEISGGMFDGTIGYLFTLENLDAAPLVVERNDLNPGNRFRGFLSGGAVTDGGAPAWQEAPAFADLLFEDGDEILNPGVLSGGSIIVVTEATMTNVVLTLPRAKPLQQAKASFGDSQIESLDLDAVGVDVELTFVFDTNPGVAADDVEVTIDGESFGTVDGNGMISVPLDPGEHEVLGISASGAAVRQTIVVPDSGLLALVLVLKSESLSQVRDYTLVTNGALEDGTLPVPGDLSFSFVEPSGAALELTDLNMVRVARIENSSFSPAGGIAVSSSLFLTEQFSIVDRAIVANTPGATISQIISSLGVGEYEVEIAAGDDGVGLPYEGFAFLRFGEFTVEGVVQATVSVEGKTVRLQSADGTVSRTTTTDATGAFTFSALPPAVYSIETQVQELDGTFRTAYGLIRVFSSLSVTLVPRTEAERDAGLLDVIVTGSSASETGDPEMYEPNAEELTERSTRAAELVAEPLSVLLAFEGNQISTTSGAEGADVQNSRTLDVPETATTATVRLQVFSAEFPVFVEQQSQFDDQWEVTVADESGAQLFALSSNVNAQLNPSRPELAFNSNSTTDLIEETIDLPEIPNASDTEQRTLTLRIVARNVGDALFPTTVTAELAPGPAFTIVARRTPSGNVYFSSAGSQTVGYVSIPDSGDRNRDDVRVPFRLEAGDEPDAVTLDDFTSIVGTIVLGTAENEIFSDTAIGGSAFQRGDTANDFQAQVGFVAPNPASVVDVPDRPGDDRVAYRLGVEATVDGETASASATTNRLVPFFAGVLEGEARSGNPDLGGDDWATGTTFRWVLDNRALLGPAIGDISGEHGRNIGHTTHRRGNDIDFRQYGGVGGGAAIYQDARDDAVAAIGGDADRLAEITAFVETQRAGIENLLANDAVDFLYGPYGEAFGVLPEGWLDSLIQTGQILDGPGNVLLDIGGSLNAQGSYIPRTQNDHNDHYHVRIEN